MSNLIERPTGWEAIGDHERRIRALEALLPCCDNSGGVFDTYGECVLANPNAMFYWPMDETSGNVVDVIAGMTLEPTTADVSGTTYPVYGLPGPFLADTANTSIGFAGTEGSLGAARARLNENPDEAAFDAVFAGTNPWTIDGFVYLTALPVTNGRVWHYWDETTSPGAIFVDVLPSGAIQAQRRGDTVTSTTLLPLTTWAHWRATYDGSTLRLFINTTEEDDAASAGTLHSTGTLRVGCNPSTPYRPLNGRLSDLAVYDDALTDFCATVGPDGPTSGSGDADEFMVLTADGSGGTYWDYPTIEALEDGI